MSGVGDRAEGGIPPSRILLFQLVLPSRPRPPSRGVGSMGLLACLLACLLAGRATGRLFLLPAVLLLAAAAALAVVVVLSCSLVVPAGMRDDGGRTREYTTCACEAGDE